LINPQLLPSGVSSEAMYPNYILFTCLILSTLLFDSFTNGAKLILLKYDNVNKYVNLYNTWATPFFFGDPHIPYDNAKFNPYSITDDFILFIIFIGFKLSPLNLFLNIFETSNIIFL